MTDPAYQSTPPANCASRDPIVAAKQRLSAEAFYALETFEDQLVPPLPHPNTYPDEGTYMEAYYERQKKLETLKASNTEYQSLAAAATHLMEACHKEASAWDEKYRSDCRQTN